MKSWVALLAIVSTLMVGCEGEKAGAPAEPVYTLASGAYELTPSDFPGDTCWPDPAFPPIIPLTFIFHVYPDGTFDMEGDGIAEGFVPPVPGFVDGNNLHAGPAGSQIDATKDEEDDPDFAGGTPDCFLYFEAEVNGTLVLDNEFDVDMDIKISETKPQACSELYGELLNVIPFPAVDNSTATKAGTCSVGITAHAEYLGE